MSLTPSDPFDRDVIALFGLPFDLGGLGAAAERVLAAVRDRRRLWLSTVNLDWLVMARADPDFADAIRASDLVTMDGVPVVMLARLAGATDAVKVAGSDLFERLRDEDVATFFLGGREGAGETAAAVLAEDARPMRAAGFRNPGFGDVAAMSGEDVIGAVNEAGADLLVVSLGAAKGQAWIAANEARLDVPVVSHLGAVVDFVAGTVDRAPRALQVAGAEWAWRIGQDPILWRRYAQDGAALPKLAVEAAEARRLIVRLKDRAGTPLAETRVSEGAAEVILDGRPERGAMLRALREARDSGHPVAVTMRAGFAPDLRRLGLLLLAQEASRRAGVRHSACIEDQQMKRLHALTVGHEGERAEDGTRSAGSS